MEGDNNLPIPNDILVEILTRVSPTSLLRFKCVCKHWYSLIQDPIFVDNQLNQAKKRRLVFITKLVHSQRSIACFYSIDIHGIATEVYPPIESSSYIEACSCNGLICFKESNSTFLKVCNPIIPRTVTLPQPRCFGDRSVWCRIGFGYDTRSRKYKLAGWISTCWPDIEVFTLGESWTKIKTTEDIHSPSVYPAQVIYANGALYWNDRRMQKEQLPRHKIFSLSLADDTYRIILGPDVTLLNSFSYDNVLCEVGGSLCLVHQDEHDETMMNLWLLQDSEKQPWVRQRICLQFPTEVNWIAASSMTIQTTETEIFVKAYNQGNLYSCRYNRQGCLLNGIKVPDSQSFPFRVTNVDNYVESLLSISDAGAHIHLIKS